MNSKSAHELNSKVEFAQNLKPFKTLNKAIYIRTHLYLFTHVYTRNLKHFKNIDKSTSLTVLSSLDK